METGKQDSNIKIKECVVKLERLEMDKYDDYDSSDSTELPFLFSTTRKKTRSKKASKV